MTVTKAPPYLAIQDVGRAGFLAAGVPRGGAMDSFAIQAANLMVGNDVSDAAVEWALGGGSLTFSADRSIALAGATVRATLAGRSVAPYTTVRVGPGDALEIGQFVTGRFLYIAVSGGFDVPSLLGSRSTYLPGHFGGRSGRLIKTGDQLPVAASRVATLDGFHCAAELMPRYDSDTVHITRGPQAELFTENA